jgi:hypothetical protein
MSHEIEYEIIEKEDAKIKFFISPWDFEAFEFRVVILLDFYAGRHGEEILNELFYWCKNNSVRQCNIRIPHDKVQETALLQEMGFHFTDTSLLVNVNLEKYISNPSLLRCNLSIANDDDRNAAAQIAYRAFTGERYHRDLKLDNHLANNRFKLWVKNSNDPKKYILLVGKEGNRVSSFFLSRIEGEHILNFSLAGIDPEFRGLGYFVYYESFCKLHEMGFKKAYTYISAFNTNVFNMIVNLGVDFGHSSVTFHKWF